MNSVEARLVLEVSLCVSFPFRSFCFTFLPPKPEGGLLFPGELLGPRGTLMRPGLPRGRGWRTSECRRRVRVQREETGGPSSLASRGGYLCGVEHWSSLSFQRSCSAPAAEPQGPWPTGERAAGAWGPSRPPSHRLTEGAFPLCVGASPFPKDCSLPSGLVGGPGPWGRRRLGIPLPLCFPD